MYVSRNWGFTPYPKEVFQEGRVSEVEWRGATGRIVADGVTTKFISGKSVRLSKQVSAQLRLVCRHMDLYSCLLAACFCALFKGEYHGHIIQRIHWTAVGCDERSRLVFAGYLAPFIW